jgi:hypothetical protein
VTTLTLHELSGNPVSLDELMALPGGQPAAALVLVYWSARCPVSRGYGTRLVAMSRAFASRAVKMVVVDPNDDEGSEELGAAVNAGGLSLRQLRDPGAGLAARFAVATTPHALVIDRSRTLVYSGAIDSNLFGDATRREHYLAEVLETLVDGRPVIPAITHSFGTSIRNRRADLDRELAELESAARP